MKIKTCRIKFKAPVQPDSPNEKKMSENIYVLKKKESLHTEINKPPKSLFMWKRHTVSFRQGMTTNSHDKTYCNTNYETYQNTQYEF